MTRIENKQAEAGFTLVEMAVVILIVGLIVGAFFAFYTPYLEQSRYQTTIERQKKIAAALTDFAQRTGRLPCPAPPVAVSPTQPLGTAATTCNPVFSISATVTDGIVPFRDLGLSQEDAMDGYYNPMTYRVSPSLTSINNTTAHANCRTNAWIPTGTTNINPRKAILCCQMEDTDNLKRISLYRNLGTQVRANHLTPIQGDTSGNPATSDFANPNSAPVAAVPNAVLTYIPYVIVSHGKNGQGSFIFNQAGRRPLMGASASDSLNANGSNWGFVVLERNDNITDANHFDDIVLWRTQQSMMRELGNDSCAVP